MPKFILVGRHGNYNYETSELDSFGIREINDLCTSLEPFVTGMSMEIFSGQRTRVTASAKIVSERFGASVVVTDALNYDDLKVPENYLERVFALVQASEADVAVLVTHVGYTKWFPVYFLEKALGLEKEGESLNKGRGWLIDCNTGELTKLPQPPPPKS